MPNSQRITPQQPVRVMVVDDSAVVRGLIAKALEADPRIVIVATAFDGVVALSEIQRQPVDVVILDVEMPRMDGLTALPELLRLSPMSKVIIASNLTQQNAELGLKALSLGATDYIAKPSSQRNKDETDQFYRELTAKILAVAGEMSLAPYNAPRAPVAAQPTPPVEIKKNALSDGMIYPNAAPKALAIASSTGGPQALLKLFGGLRNKLDHLPIFITQHMPPNFTTILANNISQACEKDCHEAMEGEKVKPGKIYLAPGDFHMVPLLKERQVAITLNQGPPVNFCRPAADPMLDALIAIYGNRLLLVVLTGMGSDGYAGARKLHEMGGTVIAQDKESCVVWGMPKAVVENHVCRGVLALDDIAAYLLRACRED